MILSEIIRLEMERIELYNNLYSHGNDTVVDTDTAIYRIQQITGMLTEGTITGIAYTRPLWSLRREEKLHAVEQAAPRNATSIARTGNQNARKQKRN